MYHMDSNKLTFEGAGTVKIDDKNHPFTFKYYKVQLLESTSGETGSAVGSNIYYYNIIICFGWKVWFENFRIQKKKKFRTEQLLKNKMAFINKYIYVLNLVYYISI